jgi:hypothetical protein
MSDDGVGRRTLSRNASGINSTLGNNTARYDKLLNDNDLSNVLIKSRMVWNEKDKTHLVAGNSVM